MKKTLIAIIIGMFALISHLTAGETSFANSNDLNNNLQIKVQLKSIEYLSNQQLPGTFRLKLHAGSVEIYNEIIDCSVNSRTVTEQIPTARLGYSNISNVELFITIEAIDSGISESQSIGILEVGETFDFDVTLHLQQSNQSSGIIVQGSIRIE